MEDLQGLESTQSSPPAAPPHTLQHIVSPLRVEVWEEYLSKHPDPTFAQYLLQGLSQGFRIGFQRTARCIRAKRNLRSTYDHPEVVDTYMAHEVDLKRVVRLPLAAADTLPHLQISPIGVIPKRSRPNKWRLIVDLSSPDGQSVNDGMDRAQCSIKYASIDDAVQLIRGLGERSLLAKLDLKDAYRIVPVHPDDRPLLGMRWRESLYVDTVLPFGLRSAPKIFSALADGLIWIMHLQGVDPSLHYLDDFLLFGPPASSACAESLATALSVCDRLGVPIAGEKTEGPATSLTFLGIQIDTRAMQLSLPQEKLHDLKGRLNHWMQSGELSTPRRSGKSGTSSP